MKLIDLLSSLPIKQFKGIGPVISFVDIYQACVALGQDNQHIIQAKLIQLEKEKLLEVVFDDQEILIGVKLAERY